MRDYKTAIYLVCFHSEKPRSLSGCARQFLKVEEAIAGDEWPYDNGDDPSFHVARRGGLLTWGVCRPDLRTPIAKGSIVVFFSFMSLPDDQVLYRLCAVETVADKVDHRAVHRDGRFSQFRDLYINALITPEKNIWRYDETDRPATRQHDDWLWLMANHRGLTTDKFKKEYRRVYHDGYFTDDDVANGRVSLANNYVVFSTPPDRGYISPDPPEIAIALKGEREQWKNEKLRELTVGRAALQSKKGRDYLRVPNKSHRNVHRQIHFEIATNDAMRWRDELIAALKETTQGQTRTKRK